MQEVNFTVTDTPINLRQDAGAPTFSSKILVVDDSALIRELIGAFLQAAGYTNIQFAGNGQIALQMIEADIPDLIILDLEMPIMDGFTVCKELRSRPETKNIPILIQSGRDTATDITRAFDYGATDMVFKPVKKYELLARTKVHLENQLLISKLTNFHTRVAHELEQARRLQLDICPTQQELENYHKTYGLNIGWHYEPSSELGGDIGGVLPIDETKISFYIADFSGHGVAAALNTFRLQTWLASAIDLYEHPGRLLSKLSAFLNKNLSSGSYATMLFFCLDIEKQELTYAAAGSQPPLLQYPELSDEFTLLSSKGMPLGLRPMWEYPQTKVPFGENAKILLYSDALVEVKTTNGQYLGDEGLQKEFNNQWRADFPLNDQIENLVDKFHQRLGDEAPDDLTIIYLENTNEYDT